METSKNNKQPEKIGISVYHGYSENQGVIECPKCGKDVWCSIPHDGQEIECQAYDCDWQGEFYDDSENVNN